RAARARDARRARAHERTGCELDARVPQLARPDTLVARQARRSGTASRRGARWADEAQARGDDRGGAPAPASRRALHEARPTGESGAVRALTENSGQSTFLRIHVALAPLTRSRANPQESALTRIFVSREGVSSRGSLRHRPAPRAVRFQPSFLRENSDEAL